MEREPALNEKELAERVKEAEKAGLLLCMTDCETVKVEAITDE